MAKSLIHAFGFPVTNVQVSVLDYNAVSISWTAPSGIDVDHYEIWTKGPAGISYFTACALNASYDLAGLEASTAYTFSIRAVLRTWPKWRYGRFGSASATTNAYRSADYTVSDDASWSSASAACEKGDIIEITAGVSLEEKTCPNPSTGTGFLTIRSSANQSLPQWDKRISSADLSNMPQFHTNQSNVPAFDVGTNTDHISLEGIRLSSTQSQGTRTNYICRINGTADTISDIQFHRCYVDSPVPSAGGTQCDDGWYLDYCKRILIKDSESVECSGQISDTQAILLIRCSEISVVNSKIVGGTENIMSGGTTHGTTGLVPTLVYIDGNYIMKPTYWDSSEGDYDGNARVVKNHLEIKYGKHFMIRGNYFYHDWEQGQQHSIVWTPRAQSGAMPWAEDRDIQMAQNWFNTIHGWINILSSDYNSPVPGGLGATKLAAYDNIVELTGTGVGTQSLINFGLCSFGRTRAEDWAIFNNTIVKPTINMTTILVISSRTANDTFPDGLAHTGRIVFKNNILSGGSGNPGGIFTSGNGYGKNAFSDGLGSYQSPSVDWQKNVIVNWDSNSPADNNDTYYPDQYHETGSNDWTNIDFEDYGNGDYRLKSTSPYIAGADDGGPCGADAAVVMALTANCVQGDRT